MDGHQLEGGTVTGWDLWTPEQGRSLGRGPAEQFGCYGEEELVDEAARDQGVVETGPAFDHDGLDSALASKGLEGFSEVDGTGRVGRRPHHPGELGKPFGDP